MKLIRINELPETGVSHNPRIRRRRIIADGTLGPITNFSRAVFPPGEQAGSHLHNDMAEVFSADSGRGEIRINDVAYVFAAGMVVVVEPGDVHEIVNTGPEPLVVTYFGVRI